MKDSLSMENIKNTYMDELIRENATLRRAITDLHFVMAGGDPCKVCTVKCLMGEGNCKPVWRGEEATR